MRWSEAEPRCRTHPDHPNSMGVCPSCLADKLSQLHASPPSSPAPPCFSDDSSPSPTRPLPQRTARDKGPLAEAAGRERRRGRRFWRLLLGSMRRRKEKGGILKHKAPAKT